MQARTAGWLPCCKSSPAYRRNRSRPQQCEHGLVVVDDKYIAFFRPNLHFLPHIWAKIVCYIKIIVYLCNELYNALFNKADRYINLVKLLSTRREGFTRKEIEEATGYSGGSLTKMLDNLERCDFLSHTPNSVIRVS